MIERVVLQKSPLHKLPKFSSIKSLKRIIDKFIEYVKLEEEVVGGLDGMTLRSQLIHGIYKLTAIMGRNGGFLLFEGAVLVT